MKDFSEFRNQWLTPEKEQHLRDKALAQTSELTVDEEIIHGNFFRYLFAFAAC